MMSTIYLHLVWGQLQEGKEHGDAKCFHYCAEAGEVIYPFIKRTAGTVAGTLYFDLVTPRGESGPVILSKNREMLVEEFNKSFQEYCETNNIVAEYIRFDPWNTNPADFSGIYCVEPYGKTYCHKLQEDFFATQYSSKRRNQVRKAMNSGLTLALDVGAGGIDAFLELYHYTAEKHRISDYYELSKEFLQNYFTMLGSKVRLSFVCYADTLIAAGMFLNGGDVYHYHFSASHPNYTNLNAISYLLMEEAKFAAFQGCKLMDLGGATPGSGLEKFKSSMTKPEQIMGCFVGKSIRNQQIYDALVEQRGGARVGFFPAYR